MVSRANSRERILESAETIILQKGFAATSIEDILEKASITKGGFFYHFGGKNELALALIERYLEHDETIFSDLFGQADNLSEDPLHQLLIFLKLLAEMMGKLKEAHPGCLVASFTYESQQFDDTVRNQVKTGLLRWRQLIGDRLDKIMDRHKPNDDVSVEVLADMFSSIIEGGIIVSRALEDKKALVDQILSYRSYLKLLFESR